ncbi:MAG: GNAT family N-acetyltransferase, partial [Ferruginibacter sp.]
YRKATENDFEFIYALFMHPTINPHLLYENMSEQDFKPIFEDLLNKEILYVFEIEEKPVGMFKLIRHTYRSAHVAYLGSFAIHPNYIGNGFGTKMLKVIIAFAKDIGIKRLELSAGVRNEKAILLYEKCGFEKEGVLRNLTYFESEKMFIDEVMMSYIIE